MVEIIEKDEIRLENENSTEIKNNNDNENNDDIKNIEINDKINNDKLNNDKLNSEKINNEKVSIALHRLNAIRFLRELLYLTRSLTIDRRIELYSRFLQKLGTNFYYWCYF